MASLRRKLIETLKTVSAPIASPIYGIKRALNSTDPAWTRTDDAIGLVANAQDGSTAVYNDFDRIYPWSDIISYNYDVTNDRINAYYGDSNFAFDGSNGDVLTLIPEFYYKRWQDSTYEYIQISKKQFEGSTKSEEFSIGRYTMSGSSSRVYSRSGYYPLTSQTIENFRTYANNLGEKFSQLDWHYFVLQMLYLVEYADYDSQTKLGLGYVGDHSSPIISGGCNSLGMKSGRPSGTDGNTSIIYRGVEDIFGNVWQLIDGINIRNFNVYICYDKTKYNSFQYSGDYIQLGYSLPVPPTSGEFSWGGTIKMLGCDANNSLIMMTSSMATTGDEQNKYIKDVVFLRTGDRVYMHGGKYNSTLADAGMWEQNLYGNINEAVGATTGARLIKLK